MGAFVRLTIKLLLDRLKIARRCAMQIGRPMFRAKSEQEQDEAISNLDEQAKEIHGKFMQLAFDLVDGTHDSSTYEDACRSLLGDTAHICSSLFTQDFDRSHHEVQYMTKRLSAGTNSYTLFTLDKLIYKIVKQLQALLADDTCIKLAELYCYEKSRGAPVVDGVYFQNAHVILQDDAVFRFEACPDGCFTIQLLDSDRAELPPGMLLLSSMLET